MPKSQAVKAQVQSEKRLTKEVHNLVTRERSLELELSKEIRLLSKEIARMKDMEVIQVFKNKWKFLGYSLLKGIMIGFGSVLGATLFISLFIYLLAQISFVPVVGDFVKSVINEIENNQTLPKTTKGEEILTRYHEATDGNITTNN
jgi:uncharacterized membrane protein